MDRGRIDMTTPYLREVLRFIGVSDVRFVPIGPTTGPTEPIRASFLIAGPLLAKHGVGYETAGQLLVTAGDNPDRLRHEASYAALCGSSPVNAHSGKSTRHHRLNRGGDRQANAALFRIVLVRMRFDPATQVYVERRTKEGKSKREVIRCLKRYVAREMFQALTTDMKRLELAA